MAPEPSNRICRDLRRPVNSTPVHMFWRSGPTNNNHDYRQMLVALSFKVSFLALPEQAEPGRAGFGVDQGVPDVPTAEIVLNQLRAGAYIGQKVAAIMAQLVRVSPFGQR